MAIDDRWEFRFKTCTAAAALASAASIVLGGFVGIYTFRQQGFAAEALKEKELRLIQYMQKRDVYYELVDAAAAVAVSRSKEDADRNAVRFAGLFFGKAHIFAIDPVVSQAKVAFNAAMISALQEGKFPSGALQSASLDLARACSGVLQAEEPQIIGRSVSNSQPVEQGDARRSRTH
jgi:hypothetical protein